MTVFRKRWLMFLVPASIALTLIACDSGVETKSTQASERKDVSKEQKNYALRPADSSWPSIPTTSSTSAASLRKNYYIVFDGSGSMYDQAENGCSGSERKMTVAKNALIAFLSKIPADTNVGMYIFDNNGREERVPLQAYNRDVLIQAIKSTRAGAGTPLSLGISTAYRSLSRQAVKQLGYGEYHLVVITDGEANKGYKPNRIINKILARSPVMVHSIGFCISGRHSLNQQGRTLYTSAMDRGSLEKGLASVLAEAPEFNAMSFEEQ